MEIKKDELTWSGQLRMEWPENDPDVQFEDLQLSLTISGEKL